MVARRFLSWPTVIPEVRRQGRALLSRSRAAETDGGINETASLRVAPKRSFSSAYKIPRVDFPAWRHQWLWLSGELRGEDSRLWYREGSERTLTSIRCGPPADGLRVAFPVPLGSASDGPYLYAGGTWDSGATISGSAVNALTDNQAIAGTDLTGINTFGTCTHQLVTAYRYYHGQGLQVDPTGSVANFGFELDAAACPASWPVTSLFWAIGPSGLQVYARIEFFDGSMASLGPPATGSNVSLVPGTWQPVSHSVTSPAGTAYVRVSGACSTTTSSSWWCDCRGAILLGDPWWWLPSDAPPAGLLSSAPAAGSVVTCGGTGLWYALCKPESDSISETEIPAGHLLVDFDLDEVWEPDSAW